MRVTRSFILSLTVAITAAGCAQQPAAYTPVASAPGIDNMVYGQTETSAQTPTTQSAPGRGLFLSAPSNSYAADPPPNDVAAPATGDVAAPSRSYVNIATPPAVVTAAYAPTVNEGPYSLDSGDRLRVVVFGQDGLTNSYVVDASGHIDMPLIGSVLARGLTTDQLANRIAGQLQNGFIREPHVAVEVEAYRPFFILGEVTQPGQYPYVADMTVETAVAIAGGFGPRGVRDQVTISRNVGGRLFRFKAPITYAVRPGDTIVVPERWF